jgi:hypothetical protein
MKKEKTYDPLNKKEESSRYKGYKYSLNNLGKWFTIFTLSQHILAFIIHDLRTSILVLGV